ncbi:general transcription factor II-I repeat domain-containing protein 2-like [Styela clava]
MTSFCGTNEDVLTLSYEVSELIAKKLKPYDNGGWVKEILVKAAEKLAPKSVHLYQRLSLSRPTVCDRIKEMGQDIEDNLKKRAEKYENFSVCLDETTDIKNTAQDLNNRIFKQVLKDFDADYDDLLYFCAVRWTSCGNMLARFHSLLPKIVEFRNLEKCLLTVLEDENWLCDLGFMVDITKHLNDLNVQLQGPDQLLHSMYSKIKCFTSMLDLWYNQLKANDCTHFPTLKKHNPTFCTQYALECSSLLESFNARFTDIKSKKLELDIFSIPFIVTPASAPSESHQTHETTKR